MNKDSGFSFVETILTVSILFLLFGTLLPLTNQMLMRLEDKKVSLHIAIAKSQAATSIQKGKLSGVVTIEGNDFTWEFKSPILCVNYSLIDVGYESCDTF